MSYLNRSLVTSEELTHDADVELSVTTPIITRSSNDVATSTRNVHRVELSSALPSGEGIDGKNTLQSFEGHDPPASLLPVVEQDGLVNPTLPGGQMINAKNTLQSFDSALLSNRRTPIDPPIIITDDTKRSPDDPLNPIFETTPPSVLAVAVANDMVFAELALELPNGNNNTGFPPVPWYKGKFVVLFLITVVVLLATVLGVYVGTSKKANAPVPRPAGSNTSPVNAPMISGNVTNTPVVLTFPVNAPITNGNETADPVMEKVSESPTVEMPDSSPTSAPNSSFDSFRVEMLTSYINNITLSDQIIVANGESPESKALAWIIANDTTWNTSALALAIQDAVLSTSTIEFRVQQRYALLTMWFQQNETWKWAKTDAWLVDLNECNWYGIYCKIFTDTGSGDNLNAVTSIILNGTRSYVGRGIFL